MENIECTNLAYEKLRCSGLMGRILKRKKKIYDMILYRGLDEEDKTIKELRGVIRDKLPSSGEESGLHRDLESFFQEFDTSEEFPDFYKFENLAAEHPGFLASYTLGQDVLKFREFGFPSRRRLEEAVTAFCLGERQVFEFVGHDWVWRNMQRNLKNVISLNEHGDLYASQCDVSSAFERGALFPEIELFESMKQAEKKSVSAYQDWSQFLIAGLKYAQHLGTQGMPVITHWREVLSGIGGGVGTNTAEAMFWGGRSQMDVDFLFERPLLEEGRKLETFPLHLPSGSDNSLTIPYICQNRLVYMKKDKNGKPISEFRGTRIEEELFSPSVEYEESDLPEVLKASYKYFARDRSLLPMIMDKFNCKNSENILA